MISSDDSKLIVSVIIPLVIGFCSTTRSLIPVSSSLVILSPLESLLSVRNVHNLDHIQYPNDILLVPHIHIQSISLSTSLSSIGMNSNVRTLIPSPVRTHAFMRIILPESMFCRISSSVQSRFLAQAGVSLPKSKPVNKIRSPGDHERIFEKCLCHCNSIFY